MKKLLLIVLFAVAACADSKPNFKPEWTTEKAPATYQVRFETTKGEFEIAVTRDYSPNAADRFYQLVKNKYFDNAIFYRVVEGFVAQFGNSNQTEMEQWRKTKVIDEPVKLQNKKGTISFARDGKDTRDLELFINLEDNNTLDTLDFNGVVGFPAFGNVTKGMTVVESLYNGYGEETMENYENLYQNRGRFQRDYPKLDLIKKAYLID